MIVGLAYAGLALLAQPAYAGICGAVTCQEALQDAESDCGGSGVDFFNCPLGGAVATYVCNNGQRGFENCGG